MEDSSEEELEDYLFECSSSIDKGFINNLVDN